MTFGVNTSLFAGRRENGALREKLRERLFDELRTNVALRVEETESARPSSFRDAVSCIWEF